MVCQKKVPLFVQAFAKPVASLPKEIPAEISKAAAGISQAESVREPVFPAALFHRSRIAPINKDALGVWGNPAEQLF